MAIVRPFRRTCRQFLDGQYAEGGRWMYLLHKKYATDPRHYVRAFMLIQRDLIDLFSYVEPSETNLATYSHRIQQLLMRTCVEIEANFTAIFLDNAYPKATAGNNLSIADYRLVEKSHRLSSYSVRLPGWKGSGSQRQPFAPWGSDLALPWYRAYNKSKHNRHEHFELASLDALLDAFCALNILLAAQFMGEEYSSGTKTLALEGSMYTYEGDDGLQPAIGDLLRIKFPTDWPLEERYEFSWPALSKEVDPFDNFDYSSYERV